MIGKTIVKTVDDYTPSATVAASASIPDDDYKIETGVELNSVTEVSLMEILLTATTGALLGNLLYHVIRNK